MIPPLQQPDLLKCVAAGDSAAMSDCIERYGALVWTLARRALGDDALAEDAVQEIFVQVWKSAAKFDPAKASEKTWIAMITRRRLIDMRRRREAALPTEVLEGVDAPSSMAGGLETAVLGEESSAAKRALHSLPDEQRSLIQLSINEGLSHGQIATHTGLPLGTVKTHLRAGLARLRHILGATPSQPDQGARS